LNLDQLRAIRKDKLKIKQICAGDRLSKQHVHFIFERAIQHFKGDLMLWIQYLDFCEKTGAKKIFSKIIARALQIHPRESGLWIRAAAFEVESEVNLPSARILLQRG